MTYSARDPNRCPVHPGQILRDTAFPALGLSKSKIAAQLGVSRQTVHALLGERQPVTPQMAVRLGKLLGNGPRLWLNLQAAHDLWHASREIDASSIPTLKAETDPVA